MKLTIFFLAFFVCGVAAVDAGDAVAIGYNSDGVWTAVTYYSSGTVKGGSDYKDEASAREAASQDLKKEAGEGIVKVSILASSDRTAHVAYARGKTAAGKDLHAVGYGELGLEAEKQAFADLKKNGAAKELKVIYRYHSHGSEEAGRASKR